MNKGWELKRKIQMAKARELYKKRHMTEEQLIKKNELDRKIYFIDTYKLAPIKDMLDALRMSEQTRAKAVIHCAGLQVTLNVEQSIEVLRESYRVLTIERQQYISELEHL